MHLDTLKLFVEVARRGSFASVARDHNAEPSSVSRAIAVLEKDLGFRLFQRSTRHMSLTEAGTIYLERIDALLRDLDRARDLAATISLGPAGTLRITASVAFGTVCLVPLLPQFRKAYPAVEVELLLSDANLDLVAERIDIAIRLSSEIETDVVRVKLMDTRYHVCAAPSYINAHGKPKAPGEMQARGSILFNLPGYRDLWRFQHSAGAVEEVPVRGSLIISNALALHAATRLGLGPALLPDWLTAGDLASGVLVDLFPDFRVAATSFTTAAWLLYPSRAFLPTKARAMIDFLKDQFPRGA